MADRRDDGSGALPLLLLALIAYLIWRCGCGGAEAAFPSTAEIPAGEESTKRRWWILMRPRAPAASIAPTDFTVAAPTTPIAPPPAPSTSTYTGGFYMPLIGGGFS